MKNPRLSAAGKALLFIFGGSIIGAGASVGLYQSLSPDTSAATGDGVNTLVSEFSAAVSAEAQAKLEQAAADAGKPAIVRKDCADITALLNKLSADSGISTKITVTPYEEPSDYFKFGYCRIEAGKDIVTFISDGDELASKSDRRYIIEELIEKLPAEDILKIHAVLSKAPAP